MPLPYHAELPDHEGALLHPDAARDLRRPAEEVERLDDELQEAIDRMLLLLCRSGYPALSGPQVGLWRQVVTVDLSPGSRHPVVLLNPSVESQSRERQVDLEGCLDLPDAVVPVSRPVQVTVSGLSRTGRRVHIAAGGMLGRLLQHHIDHLAGRLILDHAVHGDGPLHPGDPMPLRPAGCPLPARAHRNCREPDLSPFRRRTG